MNAEEFIRTTGETLDKWLRDLSRELFAGVRHATGPYSFANLLRVAESPEHFIAETCGSLAPFHPTQVRLRRPNVPERVQSATAFLNGEFDSDDPKDAVLLLNSSHILTNLTFATTYDKAVFEKKLNFQLNQSVIMGSTSKVPLGVKPTSDKVVLMNIDIVRADLVRVLYRSILSAICIQKSTPKVEFLSWLEDVLGKSNRQGTPFGLNLRWEHTSESFSRELASLAYQDINERILDQFICTHGKSFQNALNYQAHLSQPTLEWVERGELDPAVSRPDYMLQRTDGFWDVLDLKRAALCSKSLVKGIPARPQFIAYIQDMISQLVRYQTYFENPRNAAWAESTHGIRVKDLRLIGVVGNFDSFDADEVKLAMNQYKDNIVVMSYGDLINLSRSPFRIAL